MKKLLIAAGLLTFFALPARAERLVCEGGLEIDFGVPLSRLRPGEVPARFRNFPLLLKPTVAVRVLPPFSQLQLSVVTAYCAYVFVAIPGVSGSALTHADVECEGQTRPLNCRAI